MMFYRSPPALESPNIILDHRLGLVQGNRVHLVGGRGCANAVFGGRGRANAIAILGPCINGRPRDFIFLCPYRR